MPLWRLSIQRLHPRLLFWSRFDGDDSVDTSIVHRRMSEPSCETSLTVKQFQAPSSNLKERVLKAFRYGPEKSSLNALVGTLQLRTIYRQYSYVYFLIHRQSNS